MVTEAKTNTDVHLNISTIILLNLGHYCEFLGCLKFYHSVTIDQGKFNKAA